jgi:hypothetical protein
MQVDNLINSQKHITCVQDSAAVVAMIKEFSPKPHGFRQSRLKLVTHENFVKLVARLIQHMR